MLALLAASVVGAQEIEHKRGEYRFSVGPEPAFATQQEVAANWDAKAPGYSGAPWRFWLFDEQVDRRGGRDHVYTDYVYEVKDATLLGDAGRYQITFNPGYQQLVIHRVQLRRGSKWHERLVPERISLARREKDFEEDLADGNVAALIVLDDVRVDDVVRIRYSIIGSNPILAGQRLDGSTFGWGSPVLRNRLRVLYEPGRKTKIRRENDAPVPTIRETAEATEVLFEAARSRVYTDEGSYPVWYRPYPAAQVSEARSWSDVVSWALPLYPKYEQPLPADLEAQIARWSKFSDPQDRVEAALRVVQEQVRYFGVEMGDNTHRPTAPSETWSRRYGDCKDKAYLLTTMLSRMGMTAMPALVSAGRGKGITDSPPAASVFDHVVVRVQLGNETIWVDPTMTSEGGAVRDSDLSQYGVGLPIAAGVTALDPIPSSGKSNSAIVVNERYEPSEDGSEARLIIETAYRGRSADSRRRSLAGARPEEVSRRYAEYYRKRFGEVTVISPLVIKDDREANTLEVSEAYLLKSPFEVDGGIRALDVYAEALSMPAQLPDSMERTGPLNLGVPAHYRHEIEVRLPARWVSTLGDESLSMDSDAFKFERAVSVKDRSVQVIYDMDVMAKEVAADKVVPHLGELRKVRDSLYARVPLKQVAAQQDQDRDARLKALLKNAIEGEPK
ncbi:MAG TPA: DUF3857 domain-containing transglutaminase family protein [Lysobacter sp.]